MPEANQPPAAPAKENGGETPKSPGTKRGKRRVVIVVIALLLAGGGFGAWYWYRWHDYEWTDDAFIEAHITQVSPRVAGHVARVRVDDNQPVEAGTLLVELDPRDFQAAANQAQAAVSAAAARQQAAALQVTILQTTTAATLREAEAGVAAAQAALRRQQAMEAVARSQLDEATAAVTTAEAAVEEAQAKVAVAEAAVKLAGDDLARYAGLVDSGAVSRQQYDTAKQSARSQQARLKAAQAAVASAKAEQAEAVARRRVAEESLREAQAAVTAAAAQGHQAQARQQAATVGAHQVDAARQNEKAAAAELERLEAALEAARLELSYTKIYAAVSGRVTYKSVEPGDYVQPSQPLLALVPSHVWVRANFKETQLTDMRPGQSAAVYIDAYPGHRFQGKVDSIQSGSGAVFSLLPPQNATGNYVKVVQRIPVKIIFTEPLPPELRIVPGMSVEPEVKVR